MYYEQHRRRMQSLIDRNPNGPNVHVLLRGLDNLADRRQREMNTYQPGSAACLAEPVPAGECGRPSLDMERRVVRPRGMRLRVETFPPEVRGGTQAAGLDRAPAGAPASERSAAPERSQARSSHAAP
jgi:hypothetical protein